MKARDAMDPEFVGTYDCQGLEALLLAATPDGEGVYIAPDGTLMAVRPDSGWETITADDGLPLLRVRDDLYRLVLIEEEP